MTLHRPLPPASRLPSRLASSLAVAGLCAAAAAAATGVSAAAIAAPQRRRAPVARARHLAVYLHHVALGASLSACGRLFGRDRATIRYACARVEDRRADKGFDCAAATLERAVAAQRDMALALLAETTGAQS
jgi:Bacterial dnaA protein helix-turn-helix